MKFIPKIKMVIRWINVIAMIIGWIIIGWIVTCTLFCFLHDYFGFIQCPFVLYD